MIVHKNNIFFLAILVGFFPMRAAAASTTSASSIEKRIIKTFDFNERPLGNMENTPMYWKKVSLRGFPHYVNGKLDESVGTPKPSFKLQLNGGSLGYVFSERKIPAFPGSDHKIIAKYRTKNLHYARGYIKAFYMDRYGRILPDTVVYSKLIVPPQHESSKWRNISVKLPFVNPEGRFIGLGVFLVQNDSLPKVFQIGTKVTSYRKDIDTTMWIDEISIIRLPYTRLNLPDNRMLYDNIEKINLSATVADPIPDDLHANLIIHDLANNSYAHWEHPVVKLPALEAILTGHASHPKPTKLKFGPLSPGLYRISLQVFANAEVITSKSVNIAVINHTRPIRENNGMGIDLSREKIDKPKEILNFIYNLRPGWVLVPIWRNDITLAMGGTGKSPTDNMIGDLSRRDIDIVGGFLGLPKNITLKNQLISPEIWDLFASKKKNWESELAILLSRHADKIENWVFGKVQNYWQQPDSRISNILDSLRQTFNQFQGQFSLIATWPAMRSVPKSEKIADGFMVEVPVELLPESFANYFARWKDNLHRLWILIQNQDLNVYQSRPAVIDFAKRIILASRSGVSKIGVNHLWTRTYFGNRSQIEPNVYYPVFANLTDRIGGKKYLGHLQISRGESGYLFSGNHDSILVLMSNNHAAYKGKVTLGDELQAFDVWGRKLNIRKSGKTWTIPYRPIVFVDGISSNLARFISSLQFNTPVIASKFGAHKIKLMFRNTFSQTISGVVQLQPSPFWQFDPSGARFTLLPGQQFILPSKLRMPTNEPVGSKVVRVRFELEARRPIKLNLLVPLGVNLTNLKMQVLWFMKSNQLVVTQEVQNNGKDYVDLRTFLLAPGRARMERQIRRLAPGQSATKEYIVGPWNSMRGETIRLGFREIRGDRMVNEVIKIE